MREEIRQLLLSFDADEEFMESPAIGEVAEMIAGKADALQPGQSVQRYRVIEKIGAGGMGEVFLATDSELDRPVALKVLPPAYAGEDARASRFIREAKAASALNHPNIITIYEILNFEGSHLIAMEYIEGETLRSRQRRDPLTLPEIIEVASQISAALSAAHAAGIIHRDIKPENIMLRKDGLVKVLDFGLAKLTEKPDVRARSTAEVKSALTDPGIIMGTVSYMSPEQVRSVTDIDARADIWSLGVVLYETVSGGLPFTGGTTSDVIASILKNEPSGLPREYPAELDRIIHKTLRKERPERYQSIGELNLDLKSLGRELENSWPDSLMDRRVWPAAAETHSSITQNLSVQRFSLLHLLSIFVVVGAIFGGTWWFFGSRGAKTAVVETQPLRSSDIVNWSSSPGEQLSAGTFSPDGKMIAFASSKSGGRNIWIKQVATGEAIQITKDEFSNQNPIWSPDGSTLAFFSNRGDQFGIWQIPAFGGSPKLIATVGDGSTRLHRWSARNLIYFNSPQNVNLFALDIATGQANQVTDLPSAVEIALSPDEQSIAYAVPDGEKQSVWTMPLKGGDPVQIADSAIGIKQLTWHADNQRVLFDAPVDGVTQVFAAVPGGGAPRQITFADRDSIIMDVSADGTRILYGSATEDSDIWAVDLTNSTEFTITPEIEAELWASVAPSGKTIAYQSVKNLGHSDNIFSGSIFIREVNSNSNERPVQLVQRGFLPVWSPDGEQIAFMQVENDDYQIKTIKAGGGGVRQLTTAGALPSGFTIMPYNRMQETDFSWSPDSQRIAYTSVHGDGPSNIWVTSADGSGDFQVSGNTDKSLSLACPLWSIDGSRIAYTSRTQKRDANNNYTYSLMLTDPDRSETKTIFQAADFMRLIGWSQNEDDLIMASGGGDEQSAVHPPVTLFRVSLKTGERRPLATLMDAYIFNIDLSADRKQIAFVAHHDGKDNLWTLPASGGEARKVTANNDPRLYFSSLSWAADGSRIYYGKQMRYSLLSMLTDFK